MERLDLVDDQHRLWRQLRIEPETELFLQGFQKGWGIRLEGEGIRFVFE
jgi:hypothetical protein